MTHLRRKSLTSTPSCFCLSRGKNKENFFVFLSLELFQIPGTNFAGGVRMGGIEIDREDLSFNLAEKERAKKRGKKEKQRKIFFLDKSFDQQRPAHIQKGTYLLRGLLQSPPGVAPIQAWLEKGRKRDPIKSLALCDF